MITLKLWRSLYSTQNQYARYWNHVMSSRQRMMESYAFRPARWVSWSVAFAILVIFSGIWVFLVPFLPLLLLSSGTIYGGLAAMQISSLLTYEQVRNRYDLASLLPMGNVGIHWTISRITVQKMTGIEQARHALTGFCFITSLGFTSFLIFGGLSFDDFGTALLVLSGLYVDFLQSVLIGVLVGMNVATFTRDRLSANALSLLLFLTTQVTFYATVGLIGLILLPAIVEDGIVLNIIRLVTMIGMRELMLFGALHWSASRLNSNFVELDQFITRA